MTREGEVGAGRKCLAHYVLIISVMNTSMIKSTFTFLQSADYAKGMGKAKVKEDDGWM